MSQTGTTCEKLTGFSSAIEDSGISGLQDQDLAPVSSHGSCRAPQLAAFSCLHHICLQSEPWMVSRFGFSYDCQESPSPQAPQGFEGLLLVQASTHFRRFSWLFLSLSGMDLCHSQLESEEEQQGSIYFLELLSDSLKLLLPAKWLLSLTTRDFGCHGFFFSFF